MLGKTFAAIKPAADGGDGGEGLKKLLDIVAERLGDKEYLHGDKFG